MLGYIYPRAQQQIKEPENLLLNPCFAVQQWYTDTAATAAYFLDRNEPERGWLVDGWWYEYMPSDTDVIWASDNSRKYDESSVYLEKGTTHVCALRQMLDLTLTRELLGKEGTFAVYASNGVWYVLNLVFGTPAETVQSIDGVSVVLRHTVHDYAQAGTDGLAFEIELQGQGNVTIAKAVAYEGTFSVYDMPEQEFSYSDELKRCQKTFTASNVGPLLIPSYGGGAYLPTASFRGDMLMDDLHSGFMCDIGIDEVYDMLNDTALDPSDIADPFGSYTPDRTTMLSSEFPSGIFALTFHVKAATMPVPDAWMS